MMNLPMLRQALRPRFLLGPSLLAVGALGLVLLAAGPASAQCWGGNVISDDCDVSGAETYAGCCLDEVQVVWCEGGKLCGLDCSQEGGGGGWGGNDNSCCQSHGDGGCCDQDIEE